MELSELIPGDKLAEYVGHMAGMEAGGFSMHTLINHTEAGQKWKAKLRKEFQQEARNKLGGKEQIRNLINRWGLVSEIWLS